VVCPRGVTFLELCRDYLTLLTLKNQGGKNINTKVCLLDEKRAPPKFEKKIKTKKRVKRAGMPVGPESLFFFVFLFGFVNEKGFKGKEVVKDLK